MLLYRGNGRGWHIFLLRARTFGYFFWMIKIKTRLPIAFEWFPLVFNEMSQYYSGHIA